MKLEQIILRILKEIGIKVACSAGNSASYYFCYQPKEPTELEKYLK